MKSGIVYELGEIVLIPFPFSDLTVAKQRPILIISSNEYNAVTEDIIVCGITSNLSDAGPFVIIGQDSLISGFIPTTSRIKPDKIFTLKQYLVKKKLAKVKQVVLKKVKEELDKLIMP